MVSQDNVGSVVRVADDSVLTGRAFDVDHGSTKVVAVVAVGLEARLREGREDRLLYWLVGNDRIYRFER